ncbi:hypothetical protein MJ585_22680 [Klebsiella pneumoniae]|nr:hypothetical protein MJ585_22680 [Klebsiella pneumoniae]
MPTFHQTVVDPQGMTILSQISGSQNGKADYAQPKGAWKRQRIAAILTPDARMNDRHR